MKEEKKKRQTNTLSKGNFTGMIVLTQAAGSKGGASPGGKMCKEPLSGRAWEDKIWKFK